MTKKEITKAGKKLFEGRLSRHNLACNQLTLACLVALWHATEGMEGWCGINQQSDDGLVKMLRGALAGIAAYPLTPAVTDKEDK